MEMDHQILGWQDIGPNSVWRIIFGWIWLERILDEPHLSYYGKIFLQTRNPSTEIRLNYYLWESPSDMDKITFFASKFSKLVPIFFFKCFRSSTSVYGSYTENDFLRWNIENSFPFHWHFIAITFCIDTFSCPCNGNWKFVCQSVCMFDCMSAYKKWPLLGYNM